MHQKISHFLSNPLILLISTRYIFISLCKIIITCGMISLVKWQHLASDLNNISEFSTFYWNSVYHLLKNETQEFIRNKPKSFSEWTEQGLASLLFPYNAMAPPLSPQCVLLPTSETLRKLFDSSQPTECGLWSPEQSTQTDFHPKFLTLLIWENHTMKLWLSLSSHFF